MILKNLFKNVNFSFGDVWFELNLEKLRDTFWPLKTNKISNHFLTLNES